MKETFMYQYIRDEIKKLDIEDKAKFSDDLKTILMLISKVANSELYFYCDACLRFIGVAGLSDISICRRCEAIKKGERVRIGL